MFRAVVVAMTCFGIAVPQLAMGNTPVMQTADGIPIIYKVDDVALQTGGQLLGAIVDVNGRPVVDAPVAVGQSGKVLAELKTDQEGRFAITGLTNGTYQIASFAGVQSYRLWNPGAAPQSAKQGVIHVLPEGLARGNGGCDDGCDAAGGKACGGKSKLTSALCCPLLIVAAVGGAIAIAVAASDDDDAS